jgi:hypothetical protein
VITRQGNIRLRVSQYLQIYANMAFMLPIHNIGKWSRKLGAEVDFASSDAGPASTIHDL